MTRNALYLVAALAVGSVLVCAVPGGLGPLSIVGALLLVAVLPGTAVTAALFASGTLGGLTRTTLSVGLSLAYAAVGAIVLNILPVGIRALSWALLLGGVTLLGCAVASQRGIRYGGIESPAASVGARSPRNLVVPAAILGVAGILVAGAVALSAQSATDLNEAAFTQFWMQPTSTAGQLVVGIRNSDGAPFEGRLAVMIGDALHEEFAAVHIAPGETIEVKVDVSDVATADEPVVAVLYQNDDPETPYRTARLWLQ